MERFANLKRVPEKIKLGGGSVILSKDSRQCCRSKISEVEHPHCIPAWGAVEGKRKTLKKLIYVNLGDKICFIENIKGTLRVMRFTKHTALKVTPFKLRHSKSKRTAIINIFKDNKSYQYA